MNTNLLEKVLAQIVEDVKSGDLTAIQELLNYVPEHNLVSFLPEFGAIWEGEKA